MVRKVDSTLDEYDHRETNHQLARELSEARQQISNLTNENYELRRENNDLKSKINDLEHDSSSIKRKYNLIANIVCDSDVCNSRIAIEPSKHPLTLPGPFNATLGGSTYSFSSADSHLSKHEGRRKSTLLSIEARKNSPEVEESNGNNDENNEQETPDCSDDLDIDDDDSHLSDRTLPARILDRISERSEEESDPPKPPENFYSDSLDPSEVTSVTPLKSRVEAPQTPSVFNCLDTLRKNDDCHNESNEQNGLRNTTNFNSPIQPIGRNAKNNKSQDMFQSTPVQRQTRSNLPAQSIVNAMVVEISQIKTTEDQENFKIFPLDRSISETMKSVKGKKRQAAKRATPQNPEPSRYNLRKRSKKIEG